MSYTRKVFRYNNTELIYTHFIYVSPNGNDTTGDGSKDKPYQTIKFATSKLVNNTTGIILLPGIYNENPYQNTTITTGTEYYYTGSNRRYLAVSMNKGLFMSTTYQANFIGYPNKTIVNVTFNQPNSSVVLAGKNKPVYIYGITINVNCIQATAIDSNCFIASIGECKNAYIYNCIFRYVTTFSSKRGIMHSSYNSQPYYAYNCVFDMGDITNAYSGNRHSSIYEATYDGYWGRWNGFVLNTYVEESWQTTPLNAYNCMFLNIQNWLSCYSINNGAYINCANCIFPNTTNYYNMVATNSIKDDAKLDNDFYPLQSTNWINGGVTNIKNADNSISHIGVYGGIYQWIKTLSDQANIIADNFQSFVDKKLTMSYGFTINPPKTQNLEKLNNTFSGNFISSDDIKYSYPLDKREWSAFDRIEFI